MLKQYEIDTHKYNSTMPNSHETSAQGTSRFDPVQPRQLCSDCDFAARTNQRYQFLLSSYTHEIRNPLTLVYSSLQLIEKNCPSVKDTALWAQVRQDVQDCILLLRDLSPAGSKEYRQRTTIQPGALLQKIVLSFRAYAAQQHVTLRTDIAEELSPLLCNEIKIKEAILNLLLNACDAASEHRCQLDEKPCGEILLTVSEADDMLQIHVRDNGPGIPADLQDAIFEPFVTRKATGTGLGLSVIHEIAVQHGGSLSVKSSTNAPDTFTDFCLCLPAVSSPNTCRR